MFSWVCFGRPRTSFCMIRERTAHHAGRATGAEARSTRHRDIRRRAWLRAVAMWIVAAAAVPSSLLAQPTAEQSWHVALTGDDADPGTLEQPFATLERARDAAREARGRPRFATDPRLVISLAPGIHRRSQPLELDSRDHGIVIRGQADRSARLHAGRPIPGNSIRRVTDAAILDRLAPAAQDHVVAIDLAAAGVRPFKEPPVMFTDGGGLPDLYLDDTPLPLSRWPNDGNAVMEKVLDRGTWSGKPAERRGGTFLSTLDPQGEWRPSRWRGADGVWLEGYWRVPWIPQAVRIATIDPANRTITHATAIPGGIGSKYAAKGSLGDGKEPWCAVNVLEEIDVAGEWCIDFAKQLIYLWPPRPIGARDNSGITVADQTLPLIRLRETKDVSIERLSIEGGLANGIEIVGGSGNTVAGCLLRNLGGTAVTILDGTDNGVRSCDIHTIGEAGIRLTGGDRATLSPCRNFATDNDVSDVGRRRKTWAAAIHVGSLVGQFDYGNAVGCRVTHNFLHDLPHAAVLYEGNDNVLEANEVCRIALTSGDVGAFYTRQDWTSRGNLLRQNYVHDCPRANAFYIDDGDSGDTVEANVVVRCGCGPFIGGGHDNVVRNNLIIDCEIGIHFDSRGVSRGYATHPGYRRRVESAQPDAPPWSERYPSLTRLIAPTLDTSGVVGAPHGNLITGNVTAGCKKPLRLSGKPAELRDNTVEGNVDLGDEHPVFADEAAGDLRLTPGSPVLRAIPSMSQLARDSFGLQRDAYRPTLPASRQPVATPSSTPRFDSQTDLDATNRGK